MRCDLRSELERVDLGVQLVQRARATVDSRRRQPIVRQIFDVLDGFGCELPYDCTSLDELDRALNILGRELTGSQDSHEDHEIVAASGRRKNGEMIGWLTCVDCQLILQPVPICGQPTLKGRPCRTPIRTDKGYTSCWSHGEGAVRTNQPRWEVSR